MNAFYSFTSREHGSSIGGADDLLYRHSESPPISGYVSTTNARPLHVLYPLQEGEFRPLKEDLDETPPREANPERASVSELKDPLQ